MDNRDKSVAQSERVILAIAESTSHSPDEVRVIFDREYARLEAQAKVRTHLSALTASNVRAILRRVAKAPQRAA
jgi:DNA-directed RNA polymerase subunit F